MANWSLRELYGSVGKRLFAGQWTGEEYRKADAPSIDEVRAWNAELTTLQGKLEQPNIEAATAYVNKVVATDADTGFLEEDVVHDPTSPGAELYRTVARFRQLMRLLSAVPDPHDEEEFNCLREARSRHEAVVKQLQSWFVAGDLKASFSGAKELKELRAAQWGAERVVLDLENSGVWIGDRRYNNIVTPSRDAGMRISELPVPDGQSLEDQAYEFLCRLMKSPHRMTKSDAFRHLRDQISSSLAEREFERAWRRACKETGKGWDRKGRLPKRA
jgi:hypothetical protein